MATRTATVAQPTQTAPVAPVVEPTAPVVPAVVADAKSTSSVLKYDEKGISYNLTFLKVEPAVGKARYFLRSISGYLSKTSWVGHTFEVDQANALEALPSPSDWRKCVPVRLKVARFIKATIVFFPAIDPATLELMVSQSLSDEV